MTDKSTKLLKRLTAKQRNLLLVAIEQLQTGDDYGLNVKPLKGHTDLYRARVGNYRIIFSRKNGTYTQIAIVKRDDQTYRDF